MGVESLLTCGAEPLVANLGAPSAYRDRSYPGGVDAFVSDLAVSATLYVGNLSFFTSEEQLHALAARCGRVKRIVLGLDRHTRTPCGFAFVEFFRRADALLCRALIDGAKLDDRFVRVDLDPGFRDGRQFGRGKGGGQVRDELRDDFDPGRGGWGGAYRSDARPQKERSGDDRDPKRRYER